MRWTFTALVAFLLILICGPVVHGQTLEELHKAALKEGGTLNFYGVLAQINAERILPVFEKRFPGMKVNHVDATADKLAARAITEARGGRVLADIFQMALENVLQVAEQKLTVDWLPPEAAAYPANLKGSYWLAADMLFIIAAWNTNTVKKEDEPKQFEDFADAKWKGKLIAEPRDVELLIGLARHKYKNDEKASSLSVGWRPIISNFTRATRSSLSFSLPGRLPPVSPATPITFRRGSGKARRWATC